MEPLTGGMSGETFVSDQSGESVVVRVYGGRSRSRGPRAAEIDAAVLAWVQGLVPVAEVLEVRPGDPARDLPPVLVTSFLPGVLLEDLLPDLDDDGLARVGEELGTLLGRLALMATPRAGFWREPDLAITPMPAEYADLSRIVEEAVPGLSSWSRADLAALAELAADAQTRLDDVRRTCLVHSDVNPKNLLVDADSLTVTGLLDWEFAYSGSPYADLGNLLRFDRSPALVDAVLEARRRLVPDQPTGTTDVLDLARSADLPALVDLATRAEENPVAERAAARLLRIVRAGDLHAT